MKILLFGVSNVGKSTTGELLAERLGMTFYDLDDEIKEQLNMTQEELVHTTDLRWRDHLRCCIIKKLLQSDENMVIAVTPISYPEDLKEKMTDDVLTIELYDTPENIFSRLIFSDENDNVYEDDQYKKDHREYYLEAIQEDLDWYGKIYAEIGINNHLFMDNNSPAEVVDRIISKYELTVHS